MKKLKKFSKNKKSVVIFLYGPMAVGKLTVAKILSKKLGFKLTHNHEINDYVDNLHPRGTFKNSVLKEKMRHELFEDLLKKKINFVTTHAYSHDYVSKTGLSDPKDLQNIEKRVNKLGSIFCGVHLKASNAALLRRIGSHSRKKFGKLRDKKIMQNLLKTKDFQTSPKLKNNLIINNTKISPIKVVSMIIKYFKFKNANQSQNQKNR